MKKVVLKEFKKEYILIKIIFYSLFALIGLELLYLSGSVTSDAIRYVPAIFYFFAFLSLLTYFTNRVKDNYELLYFGLINVITATFILVNVFNPNSGFILADAVLLYSILNVINSIYSCLEKLKVRDSSSFIKISITILLLFLGVFVVSSLYNKVDVSILILGYYFMVFGLLQLLEIFMSILLKNKKYQKLLFKYLYIDNDENEQPKKAVKNRTIKKIKRK